MSGGDVTVALFGDCATHMAWANYRHTRAVGLTNWLSIVSPTTENFLRLTEEKLANISLNNYEKRICLLNSNKNFLSYLLAEKADYLILDCNDCRKQLLFDESASSEGEACITNNWFMSGFKKCMDVMFGPRGGGKCVSSTDISKEKYKKAVGYICDAIKEMYKPNQIILHKHYYVEQYIDENGLHIYKRHHILENDKTLDLIKYIESLLEVEFDGCHVIEFPDNVILDSKHRFGVCSLHYHSLYYDYVREAMEIILREQVEETALLNQLKFNYSMQFKVMKMDLLNEYNNKCLKKAIDNIICIDKKNSSSLDTVSILNILTSQNTIEEYLDVLYMLRDEIIIIMATKDTSGIYKDSRILRKIKRLGFTNYPAKLWWMYTGITFRGIVLVNISSSRAEEPIYVEQLIGNAKISLKAESWRRGNSSVIEINGKDWSLNRRGINVVVCGAYDGKVLDVISYDSHIMDSFYRE